MCRIMCHMLKHSYAKSTVYSSFRLSEDGLARLKLISAALGISMTSLLGEGIQLLWDKYKDQAVDNATHKKLPKVIREIIDSDD